MFIFSRTEGLSSHLTYRWLRAGRGPKQWSGAGSSVDSAVLGLGRGAIPSLYGLTIVHCARYGFICTVWHPNYGLLLTGCVSAAAAPLSSVERWEDPIPVNSTHRLQRIAINARYPFT